MKPWENGAATYFRLRHPHGAGRQHERGDAQRGQRDDLQRGQEAPDGNRAACPEYMDTASTTAKYTRL